MMSTNKSREAEQETSADEIKTCPLCGGRVFWFPVSHYWGCERCKNTFNRYTVFPDEVKKKSVSAVGNMAAMREALVELTDQVLDYLHKGLIQLPLPIEDAIAKARAALSAPARQCDVGTVLEQSKRFRDFCKIESSASGGHCTGCRAICYGRNECKLAWAQMPYQEGGGK